MKSGGAGLWNRVWFEPESSRMLKAVRTILALQALWVVLSRPDIPSLISWPQEFFTGVSRAQMLRFGIGIFDVRLEWMLFAILHLALTAIVLGRLLRASCLIAGLLLYHFAPFEEIVVGMPHTFFGGLTVPALGLIVLAFAKQPARRGIEWSPEYRWPVAFVQLLFSFNYFFAVVAKFRFAHLGWFTASNMQRWAIENWAITEPSWSLTVASSPLLCWTAALSTLTVEALFPLCVVSRTARRVLVPIAVAGHIGIVHTLGIWFPSLPLLLLFVNWDWMASRFRRAREDQQGGSRESPEGDDRLEQAATA